MPYDDGYGVDLSGFAARVVKVFNCDGIEWKLKRWRGGGDFYEAKIDGMSCGAMRDEGKPGLWHLYGGYTMTWRDADVDYEHEVRWGKRGCRLGEFSAIARQIQAASVAESRRLYPTACFAD